MWYYFTENTVSFFPTAQEKALCFYVIREKDANIRLVIELYGVLHIKEYLRCCRKDNYLRYVVGYGKIFEIAHYFYRIPRGIV